MIWTLRTIFMVILLTMLVVTSTAQMHENLFAIPPVIAKDPWFIATLFDAYFGFITFYCWVFYRTSNWVYRIGSFIAIMALGNMAMAAIMLLILFQLPATATATEILLRPATKQNTLNKPGKTA